MPLEITGQRTHNFTFTEFLEARAFLAKLAGIVMAEMQGYGGKKSWDELPNPHDPVLYLLKRSDYGWLMTPTEAFFCGHRMLQLFEEHEDSHPLRSRLLLLADDLFHSGVLSENVFFLKAL